MCVKLGSMLKDQGVTDRGLQRRSTALATALTKALRTDRHGLIVGVPCRREVPFLHRTAMRQVQNATRTRVTTATLFINGNFANARQLIPAILRRRGARVHLVASAASDARRFSSCTGIAPVRVLHAPARDAFPVGLRVLRDEWQSVAPGDVVLLCAGPLGRLLAVEWHAKQPGATYLELGSFFDPDLAASTFFSGRGVVQGPRYYLQSQCGERVDAARYQPRKRHGGCQAASDVRARLDESAIFERLNTSSEVGFTSSRTK